MPEDRRARLAALAAKAGRNIPSTEVDQVGESSQLLAGGATSPNLNASSTDKGGKDVRCESGTNYKRRRTESAAEQNADKVPSLDEALSEAKREATAAARSSAGRRSGAGDDVSALAPRKVNWDLKRDIKPKLDRLERRTQKAIVELLRERLEEEAAMGTNDDGGDDLD